jgi:hypothetical protein
MLFANHVLEVNYCAVAKSNLKRNYYLLPMAKQWGINV